MYHQEPKATEFIQFHINLKGLPQNIPKRRQDVIIFNFI